MKLGQIDFPSALIEAIREKRLVIFAGAGVSMGEPAKLPSFNELAKLISAGTGKTPEEKEPEDKFLGRLFDSGTNVHLISVQHLNRPEGVFNPIQVDLLRIFVESAQVKLVTTNFDRLFESAAKNTWDKIPEVFHGPALPLGGKFTGIVHLHGALTHWNEMVLTDRDFGRAYLTEGWARRFLLDLFTNYTVLFVGYSHEDTDLRYLARALSPQQKERFVLAPEGENSKWKSLGITPISYPRHSGDGFASLNEGVKELADFAKMNVTDWQKFIREIAAKKPEDSDFQVQDKLRHALLDISNVRFFVKNAKDFEWLGWLGNNKFLEPLFDNRQIGLDEINLYFVDWVIKQPMSQKPEEVLLFLGSFRSINSTFWWWLARHVAQNTNSMKIPVFEKWIVFLLNQAPQTFDDGHLLFELGKKAEKENCLTLLPIVFEKIISTKLVIKEKWIKPNEEEDDEKSDIDQAFLADHWNIEKLWRECLSIHIDVLGTDILSICVGFLERRSEIFLVWRERLGNWDRDCIGRSAIEPDSQDMHPESIDVVIDAARGSLAAIMESEPAVGKFWCDHLIKRSSLLLRRIAIHSVRIDAGRTPIEKMDWILQTDINDFQLWHETFIFVKEVYPKATEEQRLRLIGKIEEFRISNSELDEAGKLDLFDRHNFDWFNALNSVDPNFTPVSEKLSKLKQKYPDWTSGKRPDLLHSHGEAVWGEVRSPWTVDQLLAEKASKWLDELLAYQSQNADRSFLLKTVKEAAGRDLKWGCELAEELAARKLWSSDLWEWLFKAWQNWPESPIEARQLLKWLRLDDLVVFRGREMAETLSALVKDGGKKYSREFLIETNDIAVQIWPKVPRIEITGEVRKDWLTGSLIDTSGVLAQYFLGALSLEVEEKMGKMPDPYPKYFEMMLSESTSAGSFARTFICSQYAFLLGVDEAWTLKKVLPLFVSDNSDNFSQAWSGFVTWTRLSPRIAATLSDAFLKAIPRLAKELIPIRERFVGYLAGVILMFVENPLDKWITALFGVANYEDKLNLAQNIKDYFENESIETDQKKSVWDKWIFKYWKNRIVGTPAPLEPAEVSAMIGWFPFLGFAFPDAVGLLDNMKPVEFERSRLIWDLQESPLVDSFPNEISKILIFFLSCKCKHCHLPEIEPITKKLKSKIIDPKLKAILNSKLAEKGCKTIDEVT